MDNAEIAFNARFGGSPQNIAVPVQAVVAIYARENGKGMVFTDEDGGDDTPPPSDSGGDKPKRPSLHVVK
jgi:stringent starvation protein B